MNKKQKQIQDALLKRAVGYDVEEVSEEYSFNEQGEKFLSKRKVSQKHFSPDVSAIKILLENYGDKDSDELDNMTDEELFVERDRLLELLLKTKK